MGCKVIGCGKAVPQRRVTNDEMSALVDTSDEWIVTRTGIHERRVAVAESATDLGAQAASRALGLIPGGWQCEGAEEAVDPASIDLVVCMTISGDAVVPSQAALLKAELGLPNAIAFDVNAACAGCIYGLEVAAEMMEGSAADQARADAEGRPPRRNPYRRALVVGAERLTRLVDWTDRATCVLFGDGAGAVVLEWRDGEAGFLSSFLKNTDDVDAVLTVANAFDMTTFPFAEAVEAAGPLSVAAATVNSGAAAAWEEDGPEEPYEGARNPFICMNGQAVFKFATAAMVEAAQEALARAELTIDEVSCIVPHQANERIIRYAAKKLGIGLDRFQVSLGNVGNTSASSVLMALFDAYESGRIREGDNVLLLGFGGGLTSGALLYRA